MVVKFIFKKSSFKWTLNKKSDILEVLNYFYICPSRSAKNYRLKAIKRYHELKELKSHLASDNSILGKLWKKFYLDEISGKKLTKLRLIKRWSKC